jgi:hypothetical protein
MGTSTSARHFAPRGLFDPAWQQDSTGTMPAPSYLAANELGGGKPTGVLPAANAEPARSTGLLSRTGMFPKVSGTGQLPATPLNNVPPAAATGMFPTNTGAQSAIMSPGYGMMPKPAGTQPAPSPIILGGTGKLSTASGALRTTTGAQPAAIPMGVTQVSPILNTTGSLMVPPGEQSTNGTVKLTGPVKVVQMPVAGQPGRYVTGLLPVAPQTQETGEIGKKGKRSRKKTAFTIVAAALVFLLLSGTGAFFWFAHLHQGQTVTTARTGVSATPDVMATATAQVQATALANQILADPLSQNIHNLPTSKNEFFSGGAYHIFNTEGNAVAVVLPQQNFTVPDAYTLTMWEVKGDDTSNNNSFGMIIRFSQQNKGGKTVTTFYSFEVLNIKGGEYRFYKYDDSQGSPDKYWKQLWSQPFGSEFHLGQGPNKMNTFRIYQNGATFSFTINGKQVKTFQDSSLKSGSLGMLVNLKGTEVAFMNMLITHN